MTKEAQELCEAVHQALREAPSLSEVSPDAEQRLWLALQDMETKLATP